jgi:anti-sigma B factor antagonist
VRDAANGLVIDLSEVSFIDSSGLGAVIEAHDRLRRKNRPVAVVAPRGTAAALVLTLTQLRRRLPVYESRREALAA